jgi:hypothetical protein
MKRSVGSLLVRRELRFMTTKPTPLELYGPLRFSLSQRWRHLSSGVWLNVQSNHSKWGWTAEDSADLRMILEISPGPRQVNDDRYIHTVKRRPRTNPA